MTMSEQWEAYLAEPPDGWNVRCWTGNSDGEEVYDIIAFGGDGDPSLNESRARLIAAAPGLLEKLVTMVDHASEQYPHFESERGQRDIAAARAEIAKARGHTA